MKICPYCAEEIKDEAIVCRYCGRDLRVETNKTTPRPSQPSTITRSESLKYWLIASTIFATFFLVTSFVIFNFQRMDVKEAFQAYDLQTRYRDAGYDEYYYESSNRNVCSDDSDGYAICYSIEELRERERKTLIYTLVEFPLFFIEVFGSWYFFRKGKNTIAFILSIVPFLPFCYFCSWVTTNIFFN